MLVIRKEMPKIELTDQLLWSRRKWQQGCKCRFFFFNSKNQYRARGTKKAFHGLGSNAGRWATNDMYLELLVYGFLKVCRTTDTLPHYSSSILTIPIKTHSFSFIIFSGQNMPGMFLIVRHLFINIYVLIFYSPSTFRLHAASHWLFFWELGWYPYFP